MTLDHLRGQLVGSLPYCTVVWEGGGLRSSSLSPLFGGAPDVTRRFRLTTFRRNEPSWPTRSVEHGAINYGCHHGSFACAMRLSFFSSA